MGFQVGGRPCRGNAVLYSLISRQCDSVKVLQFDSVKVLQLDSVKVFDGVNV